jgi:hypothetical protein
MYPLLSPQVPSGDVLKRGIAVARTASDSARKGELKYIFKKALAQLNQKNVGRNSQIEKDRQKRMSVERVNENSKLRTSSPYGYRLVDISKASTYIHRSRSQPVQPQTNLGPNLEKGHCSKGTSKLHSKALPAEYH